MNPQVIGIIALVAGLIWLPTLAVVAAYAFRRLHSRERLKAIEHGLDLAFDPQAAAEGGRRAGVVLMSLGVGLALADGIVVFAADEPEAVVFLAVAVIPFVVGAGLLVDYRLGKKGTTK
jgi:hypothetical protein